MRLETAECQNFMPFKQATISFNLPGLTIIEGIVENSTGASSNGSGKSAILDLVSWVLYDRCLREDYKGDDIIRTGTKGSEGTFGVVTLLDGTRKIEVKRYRKHPMRKNEACLSVNGSDVSRGTTPETNALIEHTVGLDFAAFTSSVAFGAREDVRSFFAASDTDRKRILDTLIGLTDYTEAEKVARRRLKTVVFELEGVDKEQIRLQATLDTLNAQRASASSEESLEALDQKIAAQEARIKSAEAAKSVAEAARAKAEKAQSEAQGAYNKAKAAFDSERALHAKKLQEYNSELAELSSAKSADDATMASLKTRIAKVANLQNAECPTCSQPVSSDHVASFSQPLKNEISKLEKRITERLVKVEACKKKIADHAKTVPAAPSADTVTAASQSVAKAQASVSAAAQALCVAHSELRSIQTERAGIVERSEQLQSQADAIAIELVELDEKKSKIKEQADRLQFWVEGFGNSGLKSFLFEAAIPEINRRATTIATRLLGDGAYVRLSATTALKSKDAVREKLSIESCLPGRTKRYAGASKGQKKRLDLALLLAFRDMAVSKSAKSFDQLFADELFDGLDSTGSASVVALLREYAAKSPVILVTHDDRLKSCGDQIIQVIHDGVSARVVSPSVTIASAPAPTTKPLVRRRVPLKIDNLSQSGKP